MKLLSQTKVKLFFSVSKCIVLFRKHKINISKIKLNKLYVVKQMS